MRTWTSTPAPAWARGMIAALLAACWAGLAPAAFADAEANVDVSVGFWTYAVDERTWGPWLAILVESATFDYTSSILCDGTTAPDAVLRLGQTNKFAGPPVAGSRWPLWRQSHTGALGAVGQTVAFGASRVQAARYFAGFSAKAKALAGSTSGGSSRAVSGVEDPWRFNTQDTGDPSRHTMVAVTIALGGLLTPSSDPALATSLSKMAIDGDMVNLTLTVDGRAGSFGSDIRIADGWVAYLDAPLSRIASLVAPPTPATIDAIKDHLTAGFDPASGAWKLASDAAVITFVKDLGSTEGPADFAVTVAAHEEASMAGERPSARTGSSIMGASARRISGAGL